MGKRLAIRGHSTRGKEVIELLEMMGGKNNCDSTADNLGLSYLIDDEFDICAHYFGYDDYEDGELNIFTLEEFLEKYPYKVGDKAVYIDDNDIVVISGIEWDDTVSDIFYNVKRIDEDECFLCPPEVLKPYKETNMNKNKFGTVKEPLETKSNAVKLVDGKVKDDLNDNKNEIPSFELMFKMNDELEYKIPDGYEITEVSKNKVFIKPIKPKYPKTYEDCCKVLGVSYRAQLSYTYPDVERGNIYLTKEKHLLDAFMKLRICCNAYWKIAGEEMGLGKSWDSTYGCGEWGYWIGYNINENKIYLQDSRILVNHILVFPTKEMRDAFYENFKDLIEQCKELL